MKRIITFVIIVVLVLSLSTAAFAKDWRTDVRVLTPTQLGQVQVGDVGGFNGWRAVCISVINGVPSWRIDGVRYTPEDEEIPLSVLCESPETVAAGKDLTITVTGEVLDGQIHLYSAIDNGNRTYRYYRYITLNSTDITVSADKSTVTLSASALDGLKEGYYAVTVVSTTGSHFTVFKK